MRRIYLQMNEFYHNLRIRQKLFIAMSFIVLTYFSITMVTQQIAFYIYDEQIYRKSSQVLNLSSTSIENDLKEIEELSYKILSSEQMQGYLRALQNEKSSYERNALRSEIYDLLLTYLWSQKYILSIQLIDSQGYEYSAGVDTTKTSSSRIKKIEKQLNHANGNVVWIYPNEEDSALITAREIRSYKPFNFNHLGTLMIRLDLEEMVTNLTQGELSKANLIIRTGKGTIYPQDPLLLLDDSSLNYSRKRLYLVKEIKGEKYLLTHMKSSYTEWTYINIVPFSSIFHQIILLKNVVIIGFLTFFIFVIIGAERFAKNITNPIRDLITKMRDLEKGNFNKVEAETITPLLKQTDEVGLLYRNFRNMTQRINGLIKENYTKQIVIKETEFKALQAQINPHFLYNTLESINWLAKVNHQNDISKMVEALGYLLRSSISIKQPLVTISKEINILHSYITIQKFRYEERLDFELAVPSELDQYCIPKLTLQPLVENVIHYVLEPTVEPCKIRVRGKVMPDNITLIVEDNGRGMEKSYLERLRRGEVQTKGNGIGLNNIDERIKLAFGDNYGIYIESEPKKGTKVSVNLPYETGCSNV